MLLKLLLHWIIIVELVIVGEVLSFFPLPGSFSMYACCCDLEIFSRVDQSYSSKFFSLSFLFSFLCFLLCVGLGGFQLGFPAYYLQS